MSPPVPPDFYILSEEIPSSTPFTDMIVDSSTDLEASTPSANTSLFDDAHIDPSSGGDIPGQAMQPAASSSFKYFIDPRLDQKAVDAVTSPRMPAAISDFVDGSKYPTNNPATWPPGENGRLLEMQDLQDKHSMDQMAPMQMPTAQVQMHTPQMQMSMPFQTQVSSPYPLTTVHARRGRKSYQSHGPHQHFMQFPNMQAAALNHANSFKSSHTSTASLSVRWHPNDFAPMQGTQFNSRYGPEYFAFPQQQQTINRQEAPAQSGNHVPIAQMIPTTPAVPEKGAWVQKEGGWFNSETGVTMIVTRDYGTASKTHSTKAAVPAAPAGSATPAMPAIPVDPAITENPVTAADPDSSLTPANIALLAAAAIAATDNGQSDASYKVPALSHEISMPQKRKNSGDAAEPDRVAKRARTNTEQEFQAEASKQISLRQDVQTPSIQASVVQAPVVQPPGFQPQVVQTPIVQVTVIRTPVAHTPVVQPSVVQPRAVEAPAVSVPVVDDLIVEPPVVQVSVTQPQIADTDEDFRDMAFYEDVHENKILGRKSWTQHYTETYLSPYNRYLLDQARKRGCSLRNPNPEFLAKMQQRNKHAQHPTWHPEPTIAAMREKVSQPDYYIGLEDPDVISSRTDPAYAAPDMLCTRNPDGKLRAPEPTRLTEEHAHLIHTARSIYFEKIGMLT